MEVTRLKLSCITKVSYLLDRPLRAKALKKVLWHCITWFFSLVSKYCPLMKKLTKPIESLSCNRANCVTKVTTFGVSKPWKFSWKTFQAIASSLMLSSPKHSSLISMSVVNSGVGTRWNQIVVSLIRVSATSFSNASLSTFGFFLSSLPAPWLAMQAHCVFPLSTVVPWRAPSSSWSQENLCPRLQTPVTFLCRSAASLSVDPL